MATHSKIGLRFGRLVVLAEDAERSRPGRRHWLCQCDCGNQKVLDGENLRTGNTKSCGCLNAELSRARRLTHGHARASTRTAEYNLWTGMINRCYCSTWNSYAEYGARGVTVCDRWRFGEDGKSGYECFLADMGKRPSPELTLDRVDWRGAYGPDNCRWADRQLQARNRRTNRIVSVHGEQMVLAEALSRIGISDNAFYRRLEKGATEEEALTLPPRRPKSRHAPAMSRRTAHGS